MRTHFLALLAVTLTALPTIADTPAIGELPLGADGKPLNLDFEAGTLRDWVAEGDAFTGQPIEGDPVPARRPGATSGHQGRFWVGGFEARGDEPTGTLTSAPFAVTQPWASFLVGGGSHAGTRVEVVAHPSGEVLFTARGTNSETMTRVAANLSKHHNQQVRVRLVDSVKGGWGHVNFDDFRLHAEKPAAARLAQVPPKPDAIANNGLSPEAAAAAMTVPDEFRVTLFAGEPDVHQPVGFCIDDRGRLWVAEAYAYPRRLPFDGPLLPPDQRQNGDRIVILEDTDGDGKHDKRTVFQEGLNLVSGLEVGFGGVWVGAAPYLLFIPDKNGDDKPDGPPEVRLDGWHHEDTHETLNTFTWGPDGWLYGCQGVFTHSRVGAPGTPDDKRTPINAGVWRYHPTRRTFEVFAHGTSNPWGLDYNDRGDFFISSCVIPHCFHMVEGGRYTRQAGRHFDPYTYVDIETIADHRHYLGDTPWAGNNVSNDAGGGHAHCGLMCYQGGTWPAEYRGQLFMGNLHGRRLNMDIPKPKGSGYVASHGKDFLLANDGWARFINLKSGPDGNVYLIDWYDKQACHRNEPELWDRTNGRVYKISHRAAKPVAGVDLQKCTDAELVNYQLSENDWYARHARRILHERAKAFCLDKPRNTALVRSLSDIVLDDPNPALRLRALWALKVTGLLDDGFGEIFQTLIAGPSADKSEHVRAWAIRLLADTPAGLPQKVWDDAARDPSPVVRRDLMSALLRQADKKLDTAAILRAATSHAEDAADPNLPCLYWYALEPLAALDPGRALDLAAQSKIATLLPLAARRVGAIGTPKAFELLTTRLAASTAPPHQLAYLHALADGLKGRRAVAAPKGWPAAFAGLAKSPDADVRGLALAVGVTLRDPAAGDTVAAIAADPSQGEAARKRAVAALLDAGHPRLGELLKSLLNDPAMRGVAIRGLSRAPAAGVPEALLAVYPSLSAAQKRDAVGTLASRAATAGPLLDAVAAKRIPAADLPAETVRQLRGLGDAAIDAKVASAWGSVRESPAERKTQIAAWAKRLSAPRPPADLSHGRAVFARVCQQCHTLYGTGGKVGPEITGANRADLGYLLENIFDPSAVIPKDYAATKLALIDGRVLIGIIKDENPRTLTLLTATESITVPVDDIEKRTPSALSMMPEDLTKQLKDDEFVALIAYLRHAGQVPLPATADNAKDFFNGKDLAGWDGDRALWSVANGEIVGKSAAGLKRNQFLVSQLAAGDFRLTLQMKLAPNAENSGIQFRSVPLPDGEMRGPQADAGAGWWGKLYEEGGRGLLWTQSGEAHVKPNDWNEYVIEAKAGRVRTWINGKPCVDLVDDKVARRGVFGLQLHAGGPIEVRFRAIRLEVLGE